MSIRSSRRADVLALCLLVLAAGALFWTSPRSGDFWWSDAPRHAMDGVFYYDMMREAPLSDLQSYAVSYYLQYPALTILFYPPLFPAVEAGFFALFGVSHATAQLTVAFFYLLAMWGTYVLCRKWMPAAHSFAAALLFAGFPEIALWGRQVMLEIPAIAFVVWGAYFLVRYLETNRPGLLYVLAAMLLGGVYTKQTAAWFALPCLWMIARQKGTAIYRERHIWGSAAFLSAGLVPLGFVTWKFGSFNLNTNILGDQGMIPIVSWKGMLFYVAQLPHQVGWAPLVLAAMYATHVIWKGGFRTQGVRFFFLWFATGYGFFTLIALKHARHTTLILLPVAVFAVQGLAALLPSRYASAAAILLAVMVFGLTTGEPVPYVAGYREAVDYVAARAPKDSAILFSGYRDGNVVFTLRARGDRPDIAVLRSDKLLLSAPNGQKLDARELDISQEQIGELLNRYRVSYVVSQPNFWEELGAMQRLQAVLHTAQFKKVEVVPVSGNVGHQDTELEIYQNLAPLPTGSGQIRMEIPLVGVSLEGEFGARSAARTTARQRTVTPQNPSGQK